ncbi:Uncharacterised protein [Burkholderia cenocepacia]|nr:Uncharacterised protein [Burkholderia cenocepacia]
MSQMSGNCRSSLRIRRARQRSTYSIGSQPANSASGTATSCGNRMKLATNHVSAANVALSVMSFGSVQSRPDCWITRSSVCTRGRRSSSRSNGFDSSSIRFFRIDSRSCWTLPPADIARMRDSIRRAAVPCRAFHH